MTLYKYQGAGNDFIIADNRRGRLKFTAERIAQLCDRRYGIGADGLMLLEHASGYDFGMQYYNSDGSGGMMCGNGGRCIVAFADHCGIKSYRFMAPDGPHEAQIISSDGKTKIVRLQMKDVDAITYYNQPGLNGCFMDTGTRHFVYPVDDISAIDVEGEGRRVRNLEEFGPVGANVNFVQPDGDRIMVRTYEKGVEAETYACGTGITASAIAMWHFSHKDKSVASIDSCKVIMTVRALRDNLSVEFTPTAHGAKQVFLVGPATYVAKIII